MRHTDLLETILSNANDIKNEYKSEYLCASHIAAAAADFCKTKYTGFSPSDMTFHPSRFEEERLRYIFSKEVKLAPYFRLKLSLNAKNGVQEKEFDFSCCQRIAALRDAELLSSDVVFLCALTQLHESYTAVVRRATSDEAVLARLQDTDENIYSYVIEQIEDICSTLKKKASDAAAIRDWKPAAKFAEPEALCAMFFGKIEKKTAGSVLTLRFPRFFGATDLKVSIHRVGELYYVHDNGCAIRHLSKKLNDSQACARALKKVCHSCWIRNGKITGSFINAFRFLYYLQMLVFVAHADLYYTKAETPLYEKDRKYIFVEADQAEPLDEKAMLDELKNGIHFCYDENQGLSYWLDTNYCLFSGRASFLVETLDDKYIRISDAKKGKVEGEIFEGFYWCDKERALYSKFISKIASRFGAEFDGQNVYLTDKSENFYKAVVKFFNLAVLLSEFGQNIALPKIRQKV